MDLSRINAVKRYLSRILLVLAAIVIMAALLLTLLWRDRPSVVDLAIPPLPPVTEADRVMATWFGVSTLLFDDGQTQILVDGFISRPSLFDILLRRPVDSNVATINYFLNERKLRRLAAIIPVHSHFDHAMDIGAIANRTSASILGSATTGNIARGANVPEDQIVTVSDGAEYTFGEFTVRFVENIHAPVGWRGTVPSPGALDEPLKLPAPVTAFPAGATFSILVSHPEGTALVQGSAGFRESALDEPEVDTLFLGIAFLEGLGAGYAESYWQNTVTATGSRTIVPIHFDDYTKPFGKIVLPPKFLDNVQTTAKRLEQFRQTWDSDSVLYLPQFGVPFALFPDDEPDA